MINRIVLIIGFFFASSFAMAQDAKSFHLTARKFMMQGEYDSATIYIAKALDAEPSNLDILKDQVYVEYLKRDFSKAIDLSKKLIERSDADVQSFQLLGMSYKAIAEYKEAEKLYEKALLRFPKSGLLHSEYGEVFLFRDEKDKAIFQFEKGIQLDPGFGGNYYHAANHYEKTGDLIWAIFYAENFVNIESLSARTAEMKKLLLETFRKFYTSKDPLAYYMKKPHDFTKRIGDLFYKYRGIVADTLSPGSLQVIHENITKDWYDNHVWKYPVKLFEYHNQLIKEGLFEAYMQWLLGTVVNAEAYQSWIADHKEQMDNFIKFQRGRVFKIPTGQYYRN